MKNFLKCAVIILLVLTFALLLFACVNTESDTQGEMTLIVLDGENTKVYSVDLASISQLATKGLIAVLDYLQKVWTICKRTELLSTLL